MFLYKDFWHEKEILRILKVHKQDLTSESIVSRLNTLGYTSNDNVCYFSEKKNITPFIIPIMT